MHDLHYMVAILVQVVLQTKTLAIYLCRVSLEFQKSGVQSAFDDRKFSEMQMVVHTAATRVC